MSDTPVEVYGADHSPWVQAVLLGLHERRRPCQLRPVPTLSMLASEGVKMPAARVDGGPWQWESAKILEELGFSEVTTDELRAITRAWQGVMHRADDAATFWGAFSRIPDATPSFWSRSGRHFLRSFITLYMFLLIRTVVALQKPREPGSFAAQFHPFESELGSSRNGFLGGDKPDARDLLLFGIVECHCSIPYRPLITTLQEDPSLERFRAWLTRMQNHFADYPRLYSRPYFQAGKEAPPSATASERAAFWLGATGMVLAFPVTVPLIAFLAIRLRRTP